MKSRFLLVAFLLTFLATTWRCQSVKEGVIDPQAASPITIKEAQNWYQGASNKSARVAAEELTNRLAYWDGAQNVTLTNGTQAVMVPLFYDYRNPVFYPRTPNTLVIKAREPINLKSLLITRSRRKCLSRKMSRMAFEPAY